MPTPGGSREDIKENHPRTMGALDLRTTLQKLPILRAMVILFIAKPQSEYLSLCVSEAWAFTQTQPENCVLSCEYGPKEDSKFKSTVGGRHPSATTCSRKLIFVTYLEAGNSRGARSIESENDALPIVEIPCRRAYRHPEVKR
jgi:hypothetical protein